MEAAVDMDSSVDLHICVLVRLPPDLLPQFIPLFVYLFRSYSAIKKFKLAVIWANYSLI
jgi:hypothetical protein